MDHETELLREFANKRSEVAFTELVRRTIGFVYAAALRQTGGDVHLAKDVTQGVYLALACRAPSLQRHAVLYGWLYTTTRFVATKAVRTQARWQRREREANLMITSRDAEPAWEELRPVIDEALHELDEKDRTALLLRFFNGLPLLEVGKLIALSENAARMRVERALEKLRERLASRGITSTAGALSVTLASQPVTAVPASVMIAAGSASAAAFSAGASGTFWELLFMSTTKTKLAIAGVLVAASISGFAVSKRRAQSQVEEATQARTMAVLKYENRSLHEQLNARNLPPPVVPTASAAPENSEAKSREALRVLTDLHGSGLIRGGISIVEVEGTIEPKWANVLGLDQRETDRLNRAVAMARARLGRHELANSRAEVLPDGRVVITVQPFAEGAGIYDELVGAFRDVLGPERFQVFAAFGLEPLEDTLNQLGVGKRVLTLNHNRALAGDRNEYQMTTRIERPNGTVKQGVASDRRADGLIAFLLGPLTSHLPPGF
jgi:RNA polymerase sigma factor (sigma-70 family)